MGLASVDKMGLAPAYRMEREQACKTESASEGNLEWALAGNAAVGLAELWVGPDKREEVGERAVFQIVGLSRCLFEWPCRD